MNNLVFDSFFGDKKGHLACKGTRANIQGPHFKSTDKMPITQFQIENQYGKIACNTVNTNRPTIKWLILIIRTCETPYP